MKYKLCIIFLLFLVIVNFNISVSAMSTYEEDSWIGAKFFNNNLNKNEKFLPFLDIRKNHFEKNKIDNHFKTIIADIAILQELTLYQDITLNNLDGVNEIAEYVIDMIDEKPLYEKEINIFLKAIKEIEGHYLQLKDKINDDICYRFYHVYLDVIEEMTMEHLTYEYPGEYSQQINMNINEFEDSRINSMNINSLIPIIPEDIKNNISSPLFSVVTNYYSEEDKATIKSQYDDIIFKVQEQVFLNELAIYVSDIEILYNQLKMFLNDDFEDKVKFVIDIENDNLSKQLQEYKGVR